MKIVNITFYCEKCKHIFYKSYDEPVEYVNLENIECPFCNEEPDTYEDQVIEKQISIDKLLKND